MIQWAVAHQAPLSVEFSRQEYWSGLPCPSPGDLPDPGIKPGSPALQADSLPSEPSGKGVQNKCYEVKKNKNKTLASLGQITWECGKYWGNGM